MPHPAVPSASAALEADLDLAQRLADAADAITLPAAARRDLAVDTKADRTWVTEADRAVEVGLRLLIAAERPGDGVLGEEGGETGGGPRRWILDPIDGTANFVRRVPVWATLIALEDAGELVLGVVSAPLLGRRWWAARGLGAWSAPLRPAGPVTSESRRLQVSSVDRLADAHLSGCGDDGWEQLGLGPEVRELARRCWRERAFGDFWSHVLVAEGACDIALDPVVSAWDVAALVPIVEEAGGRTSDLAGNAGLEGGSAVSTNGLLHDQVLELVGTGAARLGSSGRAPGGGARHEVAGGSGR
ncbi:MAG: histidinol phosphatase [Actinomycetota bacterium]|nr:histidinol phosphatase [Actinomycetota bacterium]